MKIEPVRGEIAGLRSFVSRYIDGVWWRHCYDPVSTTAPLRFIHSRLPLTLTPPNGFIHDFASIPAIGWAVMGGPAGNGSDSMHGPAAILHDWAYEHQAWDQGAPLSRKGADQLFAAALEDLNVSEWRVRTMYRILRAFGGKHYRMHRDQKHHSDYTVGGDV